MKKLLTTCLALLAVSICVAKSKLPAKEDVQAVAKEVADWQIKHYEDQHLFRAPWNGRTDRNKKPYHDLQWQNATFFRGLYEFSTTLYDPTYREWLDQLGRKHNFKLHTRVFHADDHAVGQFYMKLYEYYNKPHLMRPLMLQFNEMIDSPEADKLHWWWCDALFMSPPVWAALSKATNNKKYLEYMDSQYHKTYDLLWCKEESLFFRDKSFFKKREANGEKIFWARGNGWVFGGLALMIPDLPEKWAGRDFYVDLFKTMAVKIKETQREDGTWSTGMLGSVKDYPNIETSGTAFFTFGFAWGIINGFLDRAEYEPAMLRGWEALTAAVNDDGMLTYVQGVGTSPAPTSVDHTEVYGSGAFLAAAAEMYRYAEKFGKSKGEKVRTDGTKKDTFMHNGGWCWYQGPRAVINNGKLIIGGLDGINGDVRASIYDLKSKKIDGEVVLEKGFQRDDHNAPAFYVRPNGDVMSMWAKHGSDKIHRYKVASADNYLEWSEKKQHQHKYKDRRGVTYMNLYYMDAEKSLYCFFRDGPHWNPAYITSKDHGETWSADTRLIANEIAGRHRPYTIYSQVDKNTVGIVYTDGHPRDYGNSLYYVEFKGGKFYKADGSEIHDIKNGPLLTTQGEKVYKGSETKQKPITCESVPGASWNCNMISDAQGNPHIGYTLYLNNNDHRYRLMNWDGKKWNDREIAYAGRCLYYWESSYTGLMTIDPTDPEMIYISTDVNPSTGEYLGGVHEIYKARVKASDDIKSIKWEAVTSGSKFRNVRPIIVAKDGYKVLLWLNGDWWTYLHYDVDVRGIILDRP